jgi:hypothetical protein
MELKLKEAVEAQASPGEAHGVLRSLPGSLTEKIVLLAGAVFVHVLGQLAELLGRNA